MRSIEDRGCYNLRPAQEISSSSDAISFEFHKGNGHGNGSNNNRVSSSSHHRTALGKPTPSKWDDAQKWLVGLSRGRDKSQSKTAPRNSNADDRRLIAPVPLQEHEYSSGEDEQVAVAVANGFGAEMSSNHEGEGETTKMVDCNESFWRINKAVENSTLGVRSVCVRDMGTEMTPIASQEPSRTATPIRATSPAARSPICSGSSTPIKCQHGVPNCAANGYRGGPTSAESETYNADADARGNGLNRLCGQESRIHNSSNSEQTRKQNDLETRAMAWDEAERAKYMARYKREEVKIQAWENHQKRIAEMEMKKMEVKAERLKARAKERCENKLAATRRIAEEKRANAESKLNEKAMKTSEKADYIRRTGHLPSSFSFKLPSLCW